MYSSSFVFSYESGPNIYVPLTLDQWLLKEFDNVSCNPMSISCNNFYLLNESGEWYSLENITIPSNVTKINDYAFSRADFISNVKMSDSIIRIDSWAFYSSSLSEIVLSENLEIINEYALSYCNLVSINIPKSVKEIYNNAFEGCLKLGKVYINNKDIILGNNLFCYSNETCDIYFNSTNEDWQYLLTNNSNSNFMDWINNVYVLDSNGNYYCIN